MVRKVTFVFGVVFLLLGVLGFVPATNTVNDSGQTMQFGLFVADPIRNIFFIACGVVALLAASSQRYSRWYLQGFGLVFALTAAIGLIQSDTVLGLFQVGMLDNLLHVGLAILLLGTGFGLKATTTEIPAKPV